MESISGTFKNVDTSIVITPEAKKYNDLSEVPQVKVTAANFGALFGRAISSGVGKCTMTKGTTVIDLTYTYDKSFLRVKDSGGNESVFVYQFDKLFFLDPNGEYSLILSRQV